MTEDILPNHMISVDTKDMPEFFQQEKYEGKSMMCKKLNMLPIECIVRGYITGSGWKSYKENGTVCGIKLPEGLQESDKLPEPIYTPSTKAEIGDHDENISFEQSIDHLEKYFPGRGKELAEKLRDNTIALYKKCAEYALSNRTAQDSGRQMVMNRDTDNRHLTSSSHVTGSQPIRIITGHFHRRSWIRQSKNTCRHMRCSQAKNLHNYITCHENKI